MPFRIERNDITKVHTEAIVNTANPLPIIGYGTDSAVYEAAGEDLLLSERKKIGPIERGQSAYTPGFNLEKNGIKYIIHTVGIRWSGGNNGEIDIMRNCYRNSLRLAKELNCKNISIPLLATGCYEFPKEIALNIAIDEISKFLFETEIDVVLVVYDKDSFHISEKLFSDVKSYIDENYIAKKFEGINTDELTNAENQLRKNHNDRNSSNKKQSDKKIENQTKNQIEKNPTEKNSPIEDSQKIVSHKEQSKIEQQKRAEIKSLSVEDFIQQKKRNYNFQDLLRKHIQEKNLDNPTVYKRSGAITKQLFSKILSGHIPNKHSVMALGLALQLDLDEFKTFLSTANFALNPSERFDLVIEFCITKKIYNVFDVDQILFKFDLPSFNS